MTIDTPIPDWASHNIANPDLASIFEDSYAWYRGNFVLTLDLLPMGACMFKVCRLRDSEQISKVGPFTSFKEFSSWLKKPSRVSIYTSILIKKDESDA